MIDQGTRGSYQGDLTTTTINNVANNQNPTTDLRVGTVALASSVASSVAKYLVLTNLFPGQIPQVSVYQPNNKNSGIGKAQPTKETAVLLNQDLALTFTGPNQTSTSQQQTSVGRSNQQNTLQSVQVCFEKLHVWLF